VRIFGLLANTAALKPEELDNSGELVLIQVVFMKKCVKNQV
jgi:hypothetical protein